MMDTFFNHGRFKRGFLWIMLGLCLSFPLLVHSQSQDHFNLSSLSPIQRGDFLLMQALNEEALLLYKSLIAKEEGGGYAFRGLIRAYNAMNKLDNAKSWIESYLVSKPDSSHALYGVGYIFYLEKNLKKAEELFNRALELNVENALALNNLGVVLLTQNSYAQAVNLVHEAIRVNPKEPMFFRNLQAIYKKMGNPELIVADYNLYLEEGDSERIKGYGLAVGRHLRQASFKLYNDGYLEQAILKWIEIEGVYKKINHQAGLVSTYFSLGLLHEEKGDNQNAQKYFNQVLILNPLHIQAKERIKDLQ